MSDDAAALPSWQSAASSITLTGHSNSNLVDSDDRPIATDGLTSNRQDMLQHGNAARQVVAGGKEAGERFRRNDSNEFGDISSIGCLQ